MTKAMILGAGHGTRLRPRFNNLPKVLVPVLGVSMLDRLLAGLVRGGVSAFALNTHHLAERVSAHLTAMPPHLPRPRLFHEAELLGTGGALVHAASFWEDEPLLVWNGDILCDLSPAALLEAHRVSGASATLVVQQRTGDSHLLVDASGRLCGIDSRRRGVKRLCRAPEGDLREVSFNGISVLEPGVRGQMPKTGAFDLIDVLLEALESGVEIAAYDAGDAAYGTTGSPAQLEALEDLLASDSGLRAHWSPDADVEGSES